MNRTRDAIEVNALAKENGAAGDYSEFLAHPLHICLIHDNSGAMFAWRGPGIYEVHVFFAARGRAAVDVGRAMLAWMRANAGAKFFWSLVPEDARKVAMFARWVGWKSEGMLPTPQGECELFVSEKCSCLLS